MDKRRINSIIAPLALLAATIIWGVAFVVVKNEVHNVGAVYMIAFRFTVAAAFLALVFIPRYKNMTKKTWIHGLIVGALLFTAYAFQTIGAKYTTAGNSAFLTALYVVLVPLLGALIFRKKPDLLDFICAIIAIIGIGFISLSGFSVNKGDVLTVICSLFFALHIIALSSFTKTDDICLLTMLQFLFAAALAWIVAPVYDGAFPLAAVKNSGTIFAMLFLGILSSGFAYLCQSFGQKYTKAAASAVLLSMESVFGALAGWLWGDESMSPMFIVGAVLMLIALVSGQTGLSFIPPLGKYFGGKSEKTAAPDEKNTENTQESDEKSHNVIKSEGCPTDEKHD